jgi:hypothetical protein
MGIGQWWQKFLDMFGGGPSAADAIPQADDIKDIHADIAQGVSDEKEEQAHDGTQVQPEA